MAAMMTEPIGACTLQRTPSAVELDSIFPELSGFGELSDAELVSVDGGAIPILLAAAGFMFGVSPLGICIYAGAIIAGVGVGLLVSYA